MPVRSTPPASGETTNDSSQHQPSSPAPDRRPNGSASRGAWHGADALSTIPQRVLRVTPGVSGVTDLLALRLLQRNAVYGSASGTGVSRTRHMAPRAIDAKAAERSAPIVGHGCAQPSAAPRRRRLRKRNGVLVCVSYFPHSATPHRGRLVSGSGRDDLRCT
jgi:hypothetical protein